MFGPLVKRREAKDSAERNKTTATTPVAAAAAAAAATATTTKTTPAEEASSKDFPQRRRIILKVKGSSCWLSTALGTACILARPSFFMGNGKCQVQYNPVHTFPFFFSPLVEVVVYGRKCVRSPLLDA